MADNASPITMQKFLSGMDYPASKDQIVSHAERNGADDETLSLLRGMPDQEYDGPNAVSSAFSHAR